MGNSDSVSKMETPKNKKRNEALIQDYQEKAEGEYVHEPQDLIRKYKISSARFYGILKTHNIPTRTK